MKSFRQLIFSRVKNDKVCEKVHLSKFESHQRVTIINFIKTKNYRSLTLTFGNYSNENNKILRLVLIFKFCYFTYGIKLPKL